MNTRFFMALVAVTTMTGAALLSCGRVSDSRPPANEAARLGNDKSQRQSAAPPLVVDTSTPLLLEEATESQKPSPAAAGRASADNTPCFVCHAGYDQEPLASQHAAANVGCVDCHGTSYPHRNDENNTTPPDIMYPAGKIDLSCQKCHATHNVPAAEVVTRWQQRRSGTAEPKTTVCTDCHGDHHLKLRTVQWDKTTGKLLRTGGAQ